MDSDKGIPPKKTFIADDNDPTYRDLEEKKELDLNSPNYPENLLNSFLGYNIEYAFPVQGTEADIYRIKKNNTEYVLKLYRYGIFPKLLQKVAEICQSVPDHVVQIFEYGYDEDKKRYYEIQEFARGGSLKDLIDSRKFQIKLLKTFINEISQAIHALHKHNIIYADLKPGNILIRDLSTFDLILNDFGIAYNIDPDIPIQFSTPKGTLSYLAPELISGFIGNQIDYWALGIIVLEIIMGEHPFAGMDRQIIIQILTTQNIEIPKNIPTEYLSLLKGLLTRDPKKRWGNKEVSSWLSGKEELPIYYDTIESSAKPPFLPQSVE